MDDKLSINNSDGVNFSLQLAGLGSRSYAFVIDWHIRVLILLVWLGLVLLIFAGGDFKGLFDDIDETTAYFVFGPPLFIYFFYHPVLELLMHGQTPGKRLAGVRIVTIDGQTPSTGALLIRNIFRLVDSLPVFYTLGVLVSIFTKQHVRIGDLAAGTLLVHVSQSKQKSVNLATGLAIDSLLSHADQSLLLDILDRWGSLQAEHRLSLGQKFLVRIDDSLSNQLSSSELNDVKLEKLIFQRLNSLAKGEH